MDFRSTLLPTSAFPSASVLLFPGPLLDIRRRRLPLDVIAERERERERNPRVRISAPPPPPLVPSTLFSLLPLDVMLYTCIQRRKTPLSGIYYDIREDMMRKKDALMWKQCAYHVHHHLDAFLCFLCAGGGDLLCPTPVTQKRL